MIRFVCSILLLFLSPLSIVFFIFYIICGLSDILDGYIARKAKTTSQFGAILDSISDFVFILVMLIIFIPIIDLTLWMLLWIGGIGLIRISSFVIGLIKYKTIVFLHTLGNKATGILLFFLPFIYYKFDIVITLCLLCSFATVSATEELVINIVSKRLNRDIRSITNISSIK